MTAAVPAPIQAMIDATNRGDTKGFLDAFTEDALIDDWGRTFRGRAELASWNETDNIGKQAHFEVRGVEEGDGEYIVTLAVSGNGYNGTGPMHFRLAGDRIASMIISSN
ncbi:MAG TPA: nuclear transport factor 2 family protein [Thermomicrobiales bacterium]|nr:nuclear transport factor 2 family protein [Thermomicrobiales bacterium]